MAQRQGGIALGLQAPQYAYPTQLNNADVDIQNMYQGLAPGDAIYIPAGQYVVQPGPYSFLQYRDPINNSIWRGFNTSRTQGVQIDSDGGNYRVANMTGCPVAAVVVAGGSGYAQSTTTVTSSTGGSTWQAIVGGMVSVTSVTNAGSGYGVPPLVLIPQPPSPGVQATGFAVITSGTVTSVSLTNVGAGYTTAPTIKVVPNPFDPNLASTTAIVPATVTTALVGSGSIAAVICTNNGAVASPTLTVAGAGSGASVTAVICQTATSISIISGGLAYQSNAAVISAGGNVTAVSQWVNPLISLTTEIPRPVSAVMAAAGGSIVSLSTLYDSGLFFNTGSTPSAFSLNGGISVTTIASLSFAMGSVNDTVRLIPM